MIWLFLDFSKPSKKHRYAVGDALIRSSISRWHLSSVVGRDRILSPCSISNIPFSINMSTVLYMHRSDKFSFKKLKFLLIFPLFVSSMVQAHVVLFSHYKQCTSYSKFRMWWLTSSNALITSHYYMRLKQCRLLFYGTCAKTNLVHGKIQKYFFLHTNVTRIYRKSHFPRAPRFKKIRLIHFTSPSHSY